ncbi:hypothetical protein MIMGU_mgv1a019763mg, partial [Erythranthe guttata]
MVGKRFRIDRKLQPKKCAKRCYVVVDNDRISRLPDDILVTILSFLPVKQAARTSVLSSRWINLWKHISRLDFDAESALVKIAIDYNLHSEESCKYVEWVNRVIQSHKAETLKEFRVCFDLSPSAENAITQWLEFALLRHVEKLDLDVSAGSLRVYTRDYAFPEKFLKPRSQSSSCIDFKSLKALSLKCVKLSGEAIEFFLRNCPFLEKLVLRNVNGISNLEVCGPSLALKHLEIWFCAKLKSVRVSGPNLTSFYSSHVEVLLLENVPMLVELHVNCMPYSVSIQRLLSPALSSVVSRLEILSLDIYAYIKEINLPTFPELPKLKKLVIQYWATEDKSLMGLTPLIRAPPYLEEFVLK